MQAAKRAAPQCQPLQADRDNGMRPNRLRPEGLQRESASAALRRLAREGPCLRTAPCIHRFLAATQPRN